MAKIRKTASIENGIMQVLKILNEDEIQETIGKSSSYLRKCSDPSQQQQIDHNDSIKLDIACIKKGKAPPLFVAHEYIVINESDNLDSHKQNDIDETIRLFENESSINQFIPTSDLNNISSIIDHDVLKEGFQYSKVQHLNKSKHSNSHQYYSEEMKKKVLEKDKLVFKIIEECKSKSV